MTFLTLRRKSTALAGLVALCVFLVTPLAIAHHHHSNEVVEQCTACHFSKAPVDQTAPTVVATANPEAPERIGIESEDATPNDILHDHPTRAPPAA
jgi:hypothetical protein